MVTAANVKARIDTSLTEAEVTPFLEDAQAFLANLPTAITSELVTVYLAAHFVAVRDPRARNRATGRSSVDYEGRFHFGTGLASTQYGQQAIALDLTGQLKKYADGKKKTATLTVM